MLRDYRMMQGLSQVWTEKVPAVWRAALWRLAGVWLALLFVFAADWAAIADQWWNSSTYNHMLLVPLIIGWLVWLRLPQLRKITPQLWWPGLVLFGGAALLWVLGSFAGFSLVMQAGAVAMLAASLLALLGIRVGYALVFPIGYMAFLLPFGDELVPALQMITARLTIALVHFSAIPASIDGVFIDTPAGLFEVAEACSGVKFLVAMVAFGVLVANICFTSWSRRWAFLALCVVMPVLANGVRAWGTVYVAQFRGAAYAGGFDHIVYGWIFFALVIAATVGMGWRFFDRAIDDPMIDAAAINASLRLGRLAAMELGWRPLLAGLAAVALVAQGWAMAADRLAAPLPGQIALPMVPGWQRVDYQPRYWWQPRASGADHRLLGRYADAAGRHVDVFFALYAAQDEGREAGGFGEGALPPESGWSWQAPGRVLADARSDRLMSETRVERLAETTYRTGNLTTGSNARLKLANIGDRLLLRPRPTMLLILSAEADGRQSPDAALSAFRHAAGPLDRWMDRISNIR